MSPVTTKCVPMEKADWLLAVSVYILYVCVCMHMWGWLTIIISCCVFRHGCIQCACLPVCAHAEHLTHWWQVLRAEKVCVRVCVCVFSCKVLYVIYSYSHYSHSPGKWLVFHYSALTCLTVLLLRRLLLLNITHLDAQCVLSLSSQKTCYHAFSV